MLLLLVSLSFFYFLTHSHSPTQVQLPPPRGSRLSPFVSRTDRSSTPYRWLTRPHPHLFRWLFLPPREPSLPTAFGHFLIIPPSCPCVRNSRIRHRPLMRNSYSHAIPSRMMRKFSGCLLSPRPMLSAPYLHLTFPVSSLPSSTLLTSFRLRRSLCSHSTIRGTPIAGPISRSSESEHSSSTA